MAMNILKGRDIMESYCMWAVSNVRESTEWLKGKMMFRRQLLDMHALIQFMALVFWCMCEAS